MRTVTLCILVVLACLPVFAQQPTDDHMAWWRDARFGMFIHWGPVSLKGTEIGWSRGGERRGTGGTGEIPVEVYDNLYKEFNPVEFNAKEWVQIAKNSGMKYLVFTSRHHDGFSMFDSAVSDYKITNSPFKRDVVREIADACHEAGLKVGWYHSPPDWHHPDFMTENHAKFVEYLHAQVRELCTNYGKIDIFWFDGLSGTAKDWDAERLVKMIRELQPGIVINDRAGLPENHSTPEQKVGAFNRTRPWETCMTICNQWAWKPNDAMKSLNKCIDVLVRTAGGDGNLLFNVGPMPDGRIEPRQVERLAEMGAWLKQYGETIYGTRGGPYTPAAWGASTCKGNKVYVHVLDWSKAEDGTVVLPALPSKIVGHSVLGGGDADVKQSDDSVTIKVGEAARKDPDTIIALEVEGNAAEIPVVRVSSGDIKGKFSASNVHGNDQEYAASMAFDGNPDTRWATDGGTKQAWLEVKFDNPRQVSEVLINEALPNRIQKFEIQGDGKTLYTGKTVGEKFAAKFEPVKVSNLRLNILEATEGPTVWEMAVK